MRESEKIVTKKPPWRGLDRIYTFWILRIFVFAEESVIESLDWNLDDIVVFVHDKYEALASVTSSRHPQSMQSMKINVIKSSLDVIDYSQMKI